MPRSSRSTYGKRRGRERTEWATVIGSPSDVAGDTVTSLVIVTAAILGSMTQPTIKRIRGRAKIIQDSGSIGEAVGAMGIIVRPFGALGTVQSPLDSPDGSWMWWQDFWVATALVGSVGEPGAVLDLEVDVKAQRRITSEFADLVMVFHSATGGQTVRTQFGFRTLLSEGR